MFAGEILECGAADEAQLRITHGDHRGRTRQAVDNRQFADDGGGAEKGQNSLVAGARQHGDLEQSRLDAIAAVADIAGHEQRLVGGELYRRRRVEQVHREMTGQARKQAWTGWTGRVRRHDAHRHSMARDGVPAAKWTMRQIWPKEKPARRGIRAGLLTLSGGRPG